LTQLTDEIRPRAFGIGVAGCATAVAAFLLVQVSAWPPHEDETLALFVGHQPLRDALATVVGQRGGAPLHFLFAWLVAHLGGGITELRLVSALVAVASVPVVAALVARLAGRTVALATTALFSGSWVLLFHGVYGRMYSLFLLTSALSYLALLHALARRDRLRWGLWVVAILATIATHPYGALVLATQAVYVLLRREQVRESLPAFLVVAVAGIPFWRTDLVLAGRFDVGVGGGGAKLGAPLAVLSYLRQVAGDFSAGWPAALAVVLAFAGLGLWRLAKTRRASAVLIGVVFAIPSLALLLARLGDSTSPESRHLIFALPFFSALVAGGVVSLASRHARAGRALAALAVAALLSTEVAWAHRKTPPLFSGEPDVRVRARAEAAAWLARTGRPDDLLLGYEPVYLAAAERSRHASRLIVPRADAKLALNALRSAAKPLGRGVWLFDASKPSNEEPELTIPRRRPAPRDAYEARVFGPYLIVRTREPVRTPRRYLLMASQVMVLGKWLLIGDADVNFVTVRRTLARLESHR
jgi:MFS family permease